MGFLGTVKQWMGIGGVNVQIQPGSPDISMGGGSLAGRIALTSKSDQYITKVTVKVVEEMSTGAGTERRTEEFVLGTYVAATDIPVKAGETKAVEFQVSYSQSRSFADQLASKGGVVGALGTLEKMAGDEQSRYRVHAHASVKGTALGSGAKADLRPIA